MSETARRMLLHGIAAAPAGDAAEACRYLERVLYLDATRAQKEQAHLWLGRMADDPVAKRVHLEEVLALNPVHGEARRELAILDRRLNPEQIVDPDAPGPGAGEPDAVAQGPIEARRFICPQCAGQLQFEPGSTRVACLYCGHRAPLLEALQGDALPAASDLVVALATAKGHSTVGAHAFRCQGCGATLLSPGSLSTHCPYCGSGHIVETASEAVIPPESLIPFSQDATAAEVAFRAWVDARRSRLSVRTTRVRGLYLPVWSFELMGEIGWRGFEAQRRKRLGGLTTGGSGGRLKGLRAGGRSGGLPDLSQTGAHEGSHYVLITDEIVPATHGLPYALWDLFDGYDWSGAVPYDPAYLSNWPAELYQITVADASLVARRRVLERARSKVRIQAEVRVENAQDLRIFSRNLTVTSYRLMLLPIWIANYRCDGTTYTVAVNGQSGSVVGEGPPGGVSRFLDRLLGGSA